MKLFKQAEVYAPQALGKQDVLVAGGKIIAIAPSLKVFEHEGIEVINAQGKLLVPGFVDSLVHITGGGGEGGFHTRTPEMLAEEAFLGGVSTLVGVLGTDSITRSLENLLAKAHELSHQDLSVYCYTGSYHYPAVTITESVTRDIMLIDKFIGIGEVAIADHRGSQLSVEELARLASEARVAGMLAGKSGIVSIHVGDAKQQLSLLHQVAQETEIPITQFYPTHINRNESLLMAGIEFAAQGGYIDFTTSTTKQVIDEDEIPAAQSLAISLKAGISINNITMSSDANASLPIFNQAGVLETLEVGNISSLHQAMVSAVKDHHVELSLALASITQSPANILSLAHKGRIAVGADADINLLNSSTLNIDAVYCLGKAKLLDGNLL